MNSSKVDAIDHMIYEGHWTKNGYLVFGDIINPIIENGLTPRRLFEQEVSGYIDWKYGTVGCIGAIVLGLGWEARFPSRFSEDLTAKICTVFCISENFLEGVEAGWEGWDEHKRLLGNLLNEDFQEGFKFGQQCWEEYSTPPNE
jgi:hypothetical protein